MEKKKIKTSKRGLTFSFSGLKRFSPGRHYRYILDVEFNNLILLPAKDGLVVSRKKTKNGQIKSLIDLRNREIRNAIQHADFLEIEMKEDSILVSSLEREGIRNRSLENEKIISLDRYVNRTCEIEVSKTLLRAAGAVGNISTDYHQMSFAEIFGSLVDRDPDGPKKVSGEIKDVIRVISLFSGAGMLDYPFARDKSFKIVAAFEHDEEAILTYRHNIGDHIRNVDIRSLKASDLPEADVIIGGPPCQPYSRANPSKEKRGIYHEEGDMFKEYIRLVKETEIRVFLIENVPQLLTDSYGENMDYLRGELEKNYCIEARVICDADVGGYTTRKRAFILGIRRQKEPLSNIFPNLLLRPVKTAGEAIRKVTEAWKNFFDVSIPGARTKEKIALVPEGGNWHDLPEEYRTKSVHSNMYRRLDRNKPSITICNWRKAVIIPPRFDNSGYWDRILTVAEAAALSGLDEEFEFLGRLSAKQQQCGNGVPIAMGRYCMQMIKKYFASQPDYVMA